jgi:hypothetical protein
MAYTSYVYSGTYSYDGLDSFNVDRDAGYGSVKRTDENF